MLPYLSGPLRNASPGGVVSMLLGVGLLALLLHAFLVTTSERTTALQPVSLVAAPPVNPPPAPPELKRPEPEQIQPLEHFASDQWAPGASAGPPGPAGVKAEGPLGLAEQGEAGGDVFALTGRPGGRELLLTGSGGGGDPSGRFVQFAEQLQSHVQKELNRFEYLRHSCYTAEVLLRVGASGQIEDLRLRRSTGQPSLDALLKEAFKNVPPIEATPPGDMPWPVGLRIVASRADCGQGGVK